MNDKTINCLVCGKIFKNYNSLGHHIRPIHNMTNKEYYDVYLSESNVGICQCEGCTNATKFRGLSIGYAQFCSINCLNKSNSHKQHISETKESRYGDPNYSNRDKYKQTMLDRYNSQHNWSGKVRESVKKTWLDKYDVDNPWKNKNVQEKCRETFAKNHNGKFTPFEIPEIQHKAEILANSHDSRVKANNTKEKTKRRSKFELYFKSILDTYNISYEEEYSTDKYPYLCDFYLVDYNIYVELNNFWMHNTHLFDKTNPNDIETLNIWLEKSKTCKGYKSAIQI